MKGIWSKLKWILNQIKPVAHYLIFIILFGSAISLNSIYRAIVIKKLIDVAVSSQRNKLIQVLVILAFTIILDMILHVVISLMVVQCSAKVSNGIQQRLYSRLMKTRWLDFNKYHSGDILTRMTNDVDTVSNMIVNVIPSIISLSVLLIGSFIALFKFAPMLAVVSFTLSPLIIFLGKIYSRKLKDLFLKSQQLESKYRSFLGESIQNMLIVKSFCLEKQNIENAKFIQSEKLNIAMKRTKYSLINSNLLSLNFWIGFFIVYLWGSLKLSSGLNTFGTLTAMLQLVGNIQGPFSTIAVQFPQVISALASTERLSQLESLRQDFNYKTDNMQRVTGIGFENVTFTYKQDEIVLNNVSLNIKSGEIVGLVGPSGEGKTTLIHMLLAVVNPEKGKIYLMDDMEKTEVSASTRRYMSYVPQGNTLFSGSISENLRLGNPKATDSDLENAARIACAWEFISCLPDGLNTRLGERGIGLSEGQIQRISIARAVLHRTPILLLDEATSALDFETEVQVLKNIHELDNNPICIIITHRSAALSICDRVFEINGTKIVEKDDSA